jgi:putative hemolysin
MESTAIRKIDIKKIFSDKNPKLAKRIPGFIYSYLKKILHEDWVNYFLDRHGDKMGIGFVNASIEEYNVHLNVKGEENFLKDGKYIFASNHPLGGFDGLMLLHILDKHFDDYKFLVNDLLYNIPQLRPVFIPINKHGAQGNEAAQMLDDALSGDTQILTFPAGLVSRRIKGRIQDLEWKKNFISKAVKYQRDVVPVHITGRNTNRFYNIYSVRKLLGIKANIEMLYLYDETHRHQHKTFNITFGKPIPYTTFDKSKNFKEWAYWVREKVYSLENKQLT